MGSISEAALAWWLLSDYGWRVLLAASATPLGKREMRPSMSYPWAMPLPPPLNIYFLLSDFHSTPLLVFCQPFYCFSSLCCPSRPATWLPRDKQTLLRK